jgi:hypothetical protein
LRARCHAVKMIEIFATSQSFMMSDLRLKSLLDSWDVMRFFLLFLCIINLHHMSSLEKTFSCLPKTILGSTENGKNGKKNFSRSWKVKAKARHWINIMKTNWKLFRSKINYQSERDLIGIFLLLIISIFIESFSTMPPKKLRSC